ncbi:MAG TPA: 30S ribosomal protein S5 [Candidatus Paceibacterota bacterium]|nr:30S ribosomal protein S5 [Candidatus Paceibacterota bacterium]
MTEIPQTTTRDTRKTRTPGRFDPRRPGQGRSGSPRQGRGDSQRQESDSRLLDLARVTRVRAGGRRFSFRAVVVWGDKQGHVGVGVAKGGDVAQAVEKASRHAKKRSITVAIAEGTIPHEVEAKFGASRILLKPQKGGHGLVAGGPVRIICEFAGIQNISGKFLSKTHNKLNNAMVTIEALRKLKAQKQKNADTPSTTEN